MRNRISALFPRLPAAALLLSLALTLVFWPGLATYDSVRQFDQALSGQMDDWHPPVMEWIWRQFIPLSATPAPMLILQLAVYITGMTMLLRWAQRERRRWLALALGCVPLLPLAFVLMGEIIKDCLMAAALVAATGILALTLDRPAPLRRAIAVALLLFAAMLRFNAFLACLPLMLALLPPRWTAGRARILVAGALCTASLLAAMPLINRLIGAEKSGVELSLVIFDLAGIDHYSGQDVFPPLGVPQQQETASTCYTPVKWDSFSWWTDPICPIDFERVRHWFRAHPDVSPMRWWLGAIAAHPLAYAEHRLTHWNINSQFLISDQYLDYPVEPRTAPNPWGFNGGDGPAAQVLRSMAVATGHTPLGWPCVWMALALGPLLVRRRLRTPRLVVPLALSALLYGLGYAAMSVATEIRYYLWTMLAAFFAALVTAAELRGASRWTDWLKLFGPAVVVSLMSGVARLLL